MPKYTTNKLSDPDVRHAKPKDKLYRLRDGGGLSLDVATSGAKVWRYAYRFNDKQKTFTIGDYPTIGLSATRVLRDEVFCLSRNWNFLQIELVVFSGGN